MPVRILRADCVADVSQKKFFRRRSSLLDCSSSREASISALIALNYWPRILVNQGFSLGKITYLLLHDTACCESLKDRVSF